MTMSGWKVQVEWNYGSILWVTLKYLKDSNRIELSEYTINNKIECEPAIYWWVRDAENKLYHIIGMVNNKY